MKKRAFKKFLVMILIFTLILPNFISAIGIAESAEFKLTDENGDPVQGNHFPSKQAVYIYSETMTDGHYYVEVTTSNGHTVLSNHNGTVDVVNGSFGPTNLWDLVGGYGDTNIFKVSLNTDENFPQSSNFSKTFDVVDIEGSILVEKVFNEGVTDSQTFDVVVTGPDYYQEITISQGNPITLSGLLAGDYMLVEEDLSNYDETNGIIYITISESVQYTASFLNEELLGDLTITKAVEGDPEDMTTFGLTITGPDGYEFTTQGFAQDSPIELTGLSFGLYTITEDSNPNYTIPNSIQVLIAEETLYERELTNIPNPTPLYTISGYVFTDTPTFDYSDVESNRYEGVTMELEGTQMSTTTDADGFYAFTELEEGNYTVLADTGQIISDDAVSDKDGTPDGEYDATVGPNEIDVNFGYYTTPSTFTISGYVFTDTPTFDYSDVESGRYEGVTMELEGTQMSTTTDADGFYEFTELEEGNYTVLADTGQIISDDAVSDKDGTPDGEYDATVGPNEIDVNFGYYTTPSTFTISGYVFTDTPTFDYSDVESGRYEGVTMELEGTQMSTTTDADGFYEFTELEEGNYTVLADTGQIISDDAVSDKDGTPDGEYDATVGPNEIDVNFGYYTTPSTFTISGYVFTDTPTFDYSDVESGRYEGVTMELEGTQMSTTTDADGFYEFTELEEGNYTVLADTGQIISDDAVSDKDGTPDGEYDATVGPDEIDVNFGYYYDEPSYWFVEGYVFDDIDGDNVKDLGEDGFYDVTVNLGEHASTQTDADGYYYFAEIPGDSYDDVVEVESGLLPDQVSEYRGPALSDPDTLLDSSVEIVFEAAVEELINFGYHEEYVPFYNISIEKEADDYRIKLGQTVHYTVVVTNSGTETLYSIEVTDNREGYLGTIESLEPGESSEPFEYSEKPTKTGTIENTATAEAIEQAGPVSDTVEVDVYKEKDKEDPDKYTVSGHVFEDLDEDNVMDAEEEGYEGITVEIYDDDDELIDTDTTDSDGKYSFKVLEGDYTVVVDPEGNIPEDYDSANQVTEYDDTLNQEVDINVDENISLVNFGYIGTPLALPTIISGNVFNDLNEDNMVDAGETGYSNVEVTLWDGATPVLTKATAANGQYVFNFALDPELADLEPGLYVVSIGDTPVNIYQVSEYDGAPFNQMVILTVEEDTIIIPNVNFGFKDNVVQSGETANIPMILAGLFLIASGIIVRKKSYLTNN